MYKDFPYSGIFLTSAKAPIVARNKASLTNNGRSEWKTEVKNAQTGRGRFGENPTSTFPYGYGCTASENFVLGTIIKVFW